MTLKNSIFCIALTCFSIIFLGCDMRHAVRIQPVDAVSQPDAAKDIVRVKGFSLEDVAKTFSPIIAKYEMECTTVANPDGREITCKTSVVSMTKLKLTDHNGKTQVLVEDESPIFFWTPQPFGRMRLDIEKILIEAYGVENLVCGRGFGLAIPCEGWPR